MNKVYQIITDQILGQLEKGTVPWQRPWIDAGHPKNLISKKEYRGFNVFALACQGYASPYWLTYKQAQDLGGHVKKGEKSTIVIFWKTGNKTIESLQDEKEVETKKSFFILRYYRVFNVDQCVGIDPDKVPATIPTRDFNPIEACETIIFKMPKKPEIHHKEQRAYYRPNTDTINMPKQETFGNGENYYSTLFHELSHSTGHQSRLDRHRKNNCTHHFGSVDYSKEELVAEMGAAFLCGHCGIEQAVINNQAAYIDGWMHKLRGDNQIIIKSAAQAQRAADFILGELTT